MEETLQSIGYTLQTKGNTLQSMGQTLQSIAQTLESIWGKLKEIDQIRPFIALYIGCKVGIVGERGKNI